jgi:hypothetical protein
MAPDASFLRLPVELRLEIYGLCFATCTVGMRLERAKGGPAGPSLPLPLSHELRDMAGEMFAKNTEPRPDASSLALLMVNRQVYEEALPVFRQKATPRITLPCFMFDETALPDIKRLEIEIDLSLFAADPTKSGEHFMSMELLLAVQINFAVRFLQRSLEMARLDDLILRITLPSSQGCALEDLLNDMIARVQWSDLYSRRKLNHDRYARRLATISAYKLLQLFTFAKRGAVVGGCGCFTERLEYPIDDSKPSPVARPGCHRKGRGVARFECELRKYIPRAAATESEEGCVTP